ncbi:MAG: ABC transporter permease [Pseudomonadales bacterium]|nr:ABC transporter permease [Pseudomonadales bacterium]MCC6529065.1 ABC transporter permease [Pseudomonadales bacterium]
MKKFLILLRARNAEFYRDRASLTWNLLLPLMLVVGFVFAFSDPRQDLFKVGVYAPAGGADRTALAQLKHIQIVQFDNLDKAISRVQHHQIDLLVAEGDAVRYWVNETSGKGYFVERLLRQEEKRALVKEVVQGREVRYLDWVMPGIISMNMMFGALFGVGYVIVRYRKNGVLKRLQATPVTPLQFICAQVLSRLSILLIIAVIIYAGCALFLDFLMLGSRLTLLLVAALGGLCMIALGLLVASRTESEELASGLLNFATWPMMFLSEVWFSLDGAHPVLKWLAELFPLTHLVTAARAIMVDGATLSEVMHHVTVLGGMTLLFLTLGALLFRWGKD